MNSNEPAVRSGPGDVFRHILTIITLYISAVSFGALLFAYIDRWFPDPLAGAFVHSLGAVRWAIASLVIVFPVYVWFSWAVAREVNRHPEKLELKTRKWLYHFTLFAAAAIIIGDLVALIFNFLGGDLTARFILKILAVLFIAAVVFGYYLWNLRREEMASRDPYMRWFVWGAVVIVAAATIGGFFLVGSPFRARLERFDERRAQDLQTIQWQIVNYWQRKEKLPDSLDRLRDDISGFVPPADPETSQSYEYQTLGALRFAICANFKTASAKSDLRIAEPAFPAEPALQGPRAPETWSHQAGRVCFERSIDPELYRIEKPLR